jgi:hypothetical protein
MIKEGGVTVRLATKKTTVTFGDIYRHEVGRRCSALVGASAPGLVAGYAQGYI